MTTNKRQTTIAKELSKAKDWKELAIEAREEEQKKKEKEMMAMLGIIKRD